MIEKDARVHFVGIGGAGMSAVAHVLLARGYRVSGSDLRRTSVTDRLQAMGATIRIGHDASHVADADVVVASRAVPDLNAEIVAAHAKDIPVLHRAQVLSQILAEGFGIAVVGTHGKTTTAAMTAHILTAGGLDPTALIGADVESLGGNVRVGAGRYLIAEVDESDGSHVYVRPSAAVVTSLDITDHRDYYKTLPQLMTTFAGFLALIPPDGFVVMCTDHRHVRELVPAVRARIISYGLNNGTDYTATIHTMEGRRTTCTFRRKGRALGKVLLNVPGRYNVRNAMAATAVGIEAGLAFADIASSLATFGGVSRRFSVRGEVDGIMVVDDYAHNPVKVASVLRAARESWPKRRVVAIFQPHRFSRTKTTYRQYAQAFKDATDLIITDIYPADEEPIPGVTAELIVDAVRPNRAVQYLGEKTQVVPMLLEKLRGGDLVITLGAGDIWRVADDLVAALNARSAVVESTLSPQSTPSPPSN